MSFNSAILKAMRDEGLDLDACIRVLEAGERKKDNTNAERQARHRERRKDNARYSNGVTPPNDNKISNPPEVSGAEAPSPRPWALPVGVSLQVWTDLLGNRKRKRLGNTPTAWKQFLDDLTRISALTGIPPPELIRQCAAKGWGAIYDPREQGNGRTNTVGRHQPADGLSSTARAAVAVFGAPGSG